MYIMEGNSGYTELMPGSQTRPHVGARLRVTATFMLRMYILRSATRRALWGLHHTVRGNTIIWIKLDCRKLSSI